MDNAILPGRWTVAVPGNAPGNPPELQGGGTLFGFLDVWEQGGPSWLMQIFSPADSATYAGFVLVRKNINNAGWTAWYRFATATPPQVYDLPLADGWGGSIRYSKTQEGLVSLIVSIGKAAAIGVGTFQVGILPSGYYPCNEVSCAAVNSMGSTLHTASRLVVNPSGGILLQQADETASGIFASITFAS